MVKAQRASSCTVPDVAMLRYRTLNTIHESFTVCGGAFRDIHSTRNSSSYRASYSIRIHNGWPSEPIFTCDWESVSHCFQNPNFHFFISSSANSS